MFDQDPEAWDTSLAVRISCSILQGTPAKQSYTVLQIFSWMESCTKTTWVGQAGDNSQFQGPRPEIDEDLSWQKHIQDIILLDFFYDLKAIPRSEYMKIRC